MKKVLLVGSNPSVRSPDNSGFHVSTRSRMVIDNWFSDIQDVELTFINIVDYKKEGNKSLSVSEIKNNLPVFKSKLKKYNDYKIIALGNTAVKAMRMVTSDFLEAPHPSGLNRNLNDPIYVSDFICNLKRYIEK